MLLQIFAPLLFIIGAVGNLANYYAFNRSYMKVYSTFKFLLYLSVVDLFVIVIGIPHMIVLAFTSNSYDFRSHSDFLCSTHSFLTIYFTHVSSNLLAAVSIDRVFILTKLRPVKTQAARQSQNAQSQKQQLMLMSKNGVGSIQIHQQQQQQQQRKGTNNRQRRSESIASIKKFKTRKQRIITNVELVTIAIMAIIFIFDSHFLLWMRLSSSPLDTSSSNNTTNQTTTTVCYPSQTLNPHYYHFFTTIWPWIDLLLYCYVPFFVMIICSILIIYRLFKLNHSMKYLRKKNNASIQSRSSMDKFKNLFTSNKSTTSNADKQQQPTNTNTEDTALVAATATAPAKNNGNTIQKLGSSNEIYKRRARKNRQIYNILLCLNFVFFSLVTPVVTLNTFDLLNGSSNFVISLVYILAYSNHAFNFLFYSLSCKPYRDIFFSLYTRHKINLMNLCCFNRSKTEQNSNSNTMNNASGRNVANMATVNVNIDYRNSNNDLTLVECPKEENESN